MICMNVPDENTRSVHDRGNCELALSVRNSNEGSLSGGRGNFLFQVFF